MASSDPESSASELDPLFRRLRAEPPPAAVAQTELGLPSRVAARLREENLSAGAPWLRWAAGLAPLTLACAAWALFTVNELKPGALADPQMAGWLTLLFG